MAIAPFSGRIGRRDYALGLLWFSGLTSLIGTLAATRTAADVDATIVFFCVLPVSVFFGCAFAVRRLHDLGLSGFYSLLLVVPLLGAVVGLFLLFSRGMPQRNKYGEPPPPSFELDHFLGVSN